MQETFKLTIKAENFGPLDEAFMELARVTVLIGPYNTGKTYLATLAHLLATIANSVCHTISPFGILRRHGITGYFEGEEARNLLRKYIDELRKDHETTSRKFLQFNLLRELSDHYAITSPAELIKNGTDYANIEAEIGLNHEKYIKLCFTIKKDGHVGINYVHLSPNLLEQYIDSIDKIDISESGGSITGKGVLPSFAPLYIPAERLFIMSSIIQLVELLVRTHGARYLGPFERAVSESIKYSVRPIILRYLEHLLSALRSSSLEEGRYNIAVGHLLDGSIKFDEQTLMIYYVYKNRLEIPITRASSGVAQLSALCLPLQFAAYPFVVIEEPEINLHPNHHLRVADFLAEVSKHSSILITTHSDFLMAKLAHLWAKGKISSFRAYFLDPDEHRTTELEVEETGEIELPRTIDEAVHELDSEILGLIREKGTK